MLNAASHASEFQFFIFQAHSLSIRMKHRLGLPCFKAKILRISSPRAVCFGVGRRAAWSLYLRELSRWLQWIRSLVPWIMSRLAVNAALEDWVNYWIPVNVKLYFSAESATAKFVMYTLCSVSWPPRTGGWMEGLHRAQVNFISRDLLWQCDTPGEVSEALGIGKTSWILWFSPFYPLIQLKKKYYVKSSLSL